MSNNNIIRLIILLLTLSIGFVLSCDSGPGMVYDQSNVGECDNVPDCITVSSDASTFSGDAETFENIRLSCPSDRPYVWDWGYETGNGVIASLVDTYTPDDDPDETPGAEIAIEEADDAAGSKDFRVFIACSSSQMTDTNMGIEEKSDDFEDASIEDISPAIPELPNIAKSTSATNYVSEAIWRQLTKQSDSEGKMLGITYQKSDDNQFLADAILQSPDSSLWGSSVSEFIYSGSSDCTSNCDPVFNLKLCSTDADCSDYKPNTCKEVAASVTVPGTSPTKMCVRAQDVLWDELYKVVVTAEKAADITTLYPPTGRFKDAIKNAVTYLANTKRAVTVRVMWGILSGTADEFARYITADAANVSGSAVTVYVAKFISGTINWNHSKIIAADGKMAISGGQNLWDNDYLSINPVTDMSIKLLGSAAYDAQMFAQKIWTWLCDTSWSLSISWRDTVTVASGSSQPVAGCSSEFPVTSRPAGSGNISVIGVGRLASGIESNANQADDAILALIRSAKSSVKIVQQSVVYPGPPAALIGLAYQPWMYAIADKLLEGIDVYIVTSNDNSRPGRSETAEAYTAYSTKTLANKFFWYVARQAKNKTNDELKAIVCSKLHIARFRMNAANSAWQDGREFALHPKVYVADDMAFYVGSENFYPSNLQEYGFIVADQTSTQSFISSFWNNIWRYSLRHAVTGSDLPAGRTCSLLE